MEIFPWTSLEYEKCIYENMRSVFFFLNFWCFSATLKKTGQEVCLDNEAPWVKKVIKRMMSR